jgi:hypothetical protein
VLHDVGDAVGPARPAEWGSLTGMSSVEQRAPEWIRFLRADEWGRKLIHPLSAERLNDPETFVHHTAGNPHSNRDAVWAMQQLQQFSHARGYATVAYDVVNHHSSSGIVTIMEGRGAARSAATKDRNEEGEAICLMGYFQPGHPLSKPPTEREVEGLAWGIAWMIEQGWSSPTTQILGHRDNPRHPKATSCPGDWLYAQLPTVRTRVNEIRNPFPPPQPLPPPPEGDDTVFIGYVKHSNHNAVYRQFSNGTKTWVTDPNELEVYAFLSGKSVDDLYTQDVKTMPNDSWMKATGVIVGPLPPGVDAYGIPR